MQDGVLRGSLSWEAACLGLQNQNGPVGCRGHKLNLGLPCVRQARVLPMSHSCTNSSCDRPATAHPPLWLLFHLCGDRGKT